METSSSKPTQPAPRWWPAIVILGAAAIAWMVVLNVPHRSQQHINLNIARVVLFTLGALLIWLFAFSRLRWSRRFIGLGIFVGFIGLFAAAFRIHGVDGNLVPIIEPRWASRQLSSPVPSPAPQPTNAAPQTLAGAADFPQFLGLERNGILAGPTLATNWTAQPPKLLWRQPVGAAWSGFVVSGRLAITQEQRGEEELVVAYDLESGRTVWSHADATRYFTTLAGEGPRATPTIAGGRVFAQGATGRLNCLELVTGKVIWTKDILREHGGKLPDWGVSGSPLVFDDLVIANPGGRENQSVVAYSATDGKVRWTSGKHSSSYSSPVLRTIDGVKQVLLFDDSLVSYDAATGAQLWSYRWPGGHPHIAVPIFVDAADIILSSGYGTGSGRLTVARDKEGKWTTKQVWRTNRLKAKFTNPILHKGHVYGLDDGIMACLDATTGDLKWKDGKYGHGQAILVAGLLLVMAENGDVVLVDPQPDALREVARFQALTDKTWNPPALAGEFLIVRNDKEAACFRLPTGSK